MVFNFILYKNKIEVCSCYLSKVKKQKLQYYFQAIQEIKWNPFEVEVYLRSRVRRRSWKPRLGVREKEDYVLPLVSPIAALACGGQNPLGGSASTINADAALRPSSSEIRERKRREREREREIGKHKWERDIMFEWNNFKIFVHDFFSCDEWDLLPFLAKGIKVMKWRIAELREEKRSHVWLACMYTLFYSYAPSSNGNNIKDIKTVFSL